MDLRTIAVVLGLAASSMVFADGHRGVLPCPADAQVQMDAEFGAGTSAQTECLQKRDDIQVVMAWNNREVNKKGVGQQVANVRNYVENLEGMYGLRINDDFVVRVVGYQSGARWMLSDEAYNRTLGVTTGNPSRPAVEWLLAKGVKMEMCQNTMRNLGYVTSDLLPGVTQVPAGVAALIDYSMRGYTYLTP